MALYNYDWTDKSPKLKQSIVLMMTAATNPLKISVGGFYSLSMISYRIVSNASNDCNLFIISNRILVHNVTLVSYCAVTGAFSHENQSREQGGHENPIKFTRSSYKLKAQNGKVLN